MKITKIEIKNFKAFRGPDIIKLNENRQKGQNLLLYGENGSGKTSLYKALELFLESSENDSLKFIDHKNFPAIDDGDGGYVKLHFTPDPKLQKTNYEWSDSEDALNDTKVQPIREASKAKGFLDYKALLDTHYLQYKDDTVDVFDLMIGTLLKNVINDISVPSRSFAEEWQDLSELLFPEQAAEEVEIPQQQFADFNIGIENILTRLKADANKILPKFGYENTVVELDLEYHEPNFNNDTNKYEPPQILLKVSFLGSIRPKHHQFLNEAKLSAIALSIFFAGFQLQPPSDLKILVIDDALIGLDISHRLPLLDILDERYFAKYQIILMTYDRTFYEMVKKRKSEDAKWKAAELYCRKVDGHDIPVYVEDKTYLEKARVYLDANDYKACAVYVRTAYEATIKGYCEKNNIAVKYREDRNELDSNDFWTLIRDKKIPNPKGGRGKRLLKLALVKKIESARKFTLNPLSHANIVNIPRKELEDAIEAVEWLEDALA
ncbi:MAG: AAA family ATPase [Candidatus Poribacteria bacterium]|nr:AAA family ATPase [Candidatus Poribacteria bacterium]